MQILTDKEKDILDKAEDVIKREIEALLEKNRGFQGLSSVDCEILQTLMITLDQTVRIRNAEMPILHTPTSYSPEIELNPEMRLVSVERHG